MEIWKDIKGYEGKYQVSNLGNVKSLNYKRSKKEATLKPTKNKDGYLIVDLLKEKNRKPCRVHRLVASEFILNVENKPCINHKDGNKTNNRVSNLEWNTYKENISHAVKTGLRNNISKIILQYDKQGNLIKEWKSSMEIERQLKINHAPICRCCNNKRKTAGGYIWRYKDAI